MYDGCPKNFDMIWWEQTAFDGKTVQPCPAGAQGQASRSCHKEIGWGPPDMFNCVSDTFIELRDLVGSFGNRNCAFVEFEYLSSNLLNNGCPSRQRKGCKFISSSTPNVKCSVVRKSLRATRSFPHSFGALMMRSWRSLPI